MHSPFDWQSCVLVALWVWSTMKACSLARNSSGPTAAVARRRDRASSFCRLRCCGSVQHPYAAAAGPESVWRCSANPPPPAAARSTEHPSHRGSTLPLLVCSRGRIACHTLIGRIGRAGTECSGPSGCEWGHFAPRPSRDARGTARGLALRASAELSPPSLRPRNPNCDCRQGRGSSAISAASRKGLAPQ
jgi:hypothetical protein